MSEEVQRNEAILAAVENAGGGYVWDAECFAVTLMDVSVSNELIQVLEGLVGVQQIAMDASTLELSAMLRIACIPGLRSLVLNHSCLNDEDAVRLALIGPEILYVQE